MENVLTEIFKFKLKNKVDAFIITVFPNDLKRKIRNR